MILASSLPAEAVLALRKFSLLGMVARLVFALTNQIKSSTFLEMRSLSQKYSLPDPILILTDPPDKLSWKKICKSHVTSFWHKKYCYEISQCPSLCFLRPHFIPLDDRSHPLWSSCRSSSTTVKAATVQATLLTGMYPHDLLRSKGDGGAGSCRLP